MLDFYLDGTSSRLAELARACGLGRDGDDTQALANSLIEEIRWLNEYLGLPLKIEQIAEKDIAENVKRVLSEEHVTYPVPKYMSADDCDTVMRHAAGWAMAVKGEG